jgi:GGDEF domain-containing protein
MMRLPALLASLRRRPRGLVFVGAALLAGAGLLAIGDARRRARAGAATADPETGLRPRGEFDRLLALLLQAGRRGTPPVSVVLVGLQAPPRTRMDEAGWRSAIRAVGRSLAATAPERAYRLGEGQFALLLPRTEAAEAAALASEVAEGARAALAGVGADRTDGVRPRVCLATSGDDRTTADELLRRAEEQPLEAAPAR